MKVFMLGWEFPPHSSGGLGTACYGLTKGLARKGIEITFVMPSGTESELSSHVNLIIGDKSFGKIKFKNIDSCLIPYLTSSKYSERLSFFGEKGSIYGKDMFKEVARFTEQVKAIIDDSFDVIHAHDWMTFKAGAAAKEKINKPLIVHVHATEFDRTGDNPNQYVYDIEREGMHKADKIIAVSNFTKNKIIEHYGIKEEKIEVVHNAVDQDNRLNVTSKVRRMDKVVLFLGRITLQKGPDYFLYAANKVLEKDPYVKFIIVGSGDMEPFIIEKAAELGIASKVLFTGFLSGQDVDRAYQLADLYVMPSVSEPFGITPLEAIKNDVPVIISKQSGVSEVLQNCLKVDFWDVDELADKMLAVLRYKSLGESLRENASFELQKFSWGIPAEKCIAVYQNVVGDVNG